MTSKMSLIAPVMSLSGLSSAKIESATSQQPLPSSTFFPNSMVLTDSSLCSSGTRLVSWYYRLLTGIPATWPSSYLQLKFFGQSLLDPAHHHHPRKLSTRASRILGQRLSLNICHSFWSIHRWLGGSNLQIRKQLPERRNPWGPCNVGRTRVPCPT